MIPVVAYWYNDPEQLQSKLPLATVGRHAARHGFNDTPLHLLCLRGPQLPTSLQREWEDYGFRFHDGRRIFEQRAAQFASLRTCCPAAFFECFLRWLVMGDYFRGENLLSLDADIFLNVPLSQLLHPLDGATGTATSTCAAPISDPGWFSRYESELLRLTTDKAGYLRRMRAEMPGLLVGTPEFPRRETVFGLKAFHALDSEEAWRAHFDSTPEELFVDYLVRSGRLPQEPWSQRLPFLLCPQFLILPQLAWVTPLPAPLPDRLETPLRLTRAGGSYALNGQPLAFIHFQGGCSRLYAAKLIMEHLFRGATESPRLKSDLHPGPLPAPETSLFLNAYRRLQKANPNDHHIREFCARHPAPFNETQLTERIMLDLSLTEIFNAEISDSLDLWAA